MPSPPSSPRRDWLSARLEKVGSWRRRKGAPCTSPDTDNADTLDRPAPAHDEGRVDGAQMRAMVEEAVTAQLEAYMRRVAGALSDDAATSKPEDPLASELSRLVAATLDRKLADAQRSSSPVSPQAGANGRDESLQELGPSHPAVPDLQTGVCRADATVTPRVLVCTDDGVDSKAPRAPLSPLRLFLSKPPSFKRWGRQASIRSSNTDPCSVASLDDLPDAPPETALGTHEASSPAVSDLLGKILTVSLAVWSAFMLAAAMNMDTALRKT